MTHLENRRKAEPMRKMYIPAGRSFARFASLLQMDNTAIILKWRLKLWNFPD
jgi:hypothetical protein